MLAEASKIRQQFLSFIKVAHTHIAKSSNSRNLLLLKNNNNIDVSPLSLKVGSWSALLFNANMRKLQKPLLLLLLLSLLPCCLKTQDALIKHGRHHHDGRRRRFSSGYRSSSRTSGWKKRRKCISKWLAATLECASLDMYYYIAVSLLRGAPWGVKVTKSIIPIYAMAPSALTMLASSLASSSKASWNRR